MLLSAPGILGRHRGLHMLLCQSRMAHDVAEDVRRVIEQAERAASTWTTLETDFYTPAVVAEAQRALAPLSEVDMVTWGGYPQAERCRLTVGRGDAVAALAADPQQIDSVAAVNVKGTFMFDPKNHRDFLGACLGTGIERSKVGDILIQGEQGAHIMVVPELVVHLEMSLKSVGKVSVETQEMALSELKVREPQVQDIKSVEASLRLDAIASAGFRMSRSKITDMIKKGDVRLNWKEVTSASRIVKEGDLISCAGKGRCEVKQLGITKKGKHVVQLQRLI
eukprot:jgi/Astpho2/6063/fgenesh1_pm.00084_%23_16_t